MFNKKLYHPKWSLIRLKVLKRAQYACEGTPLHPDCQAQELAPHPETGKFVVLSVCHLDHNRDNNRFFNLRAVCQRCHLDHDRHEKTFGRKYGKELKKYQLKLFTPSPLEQIVESNLMFANPIYYKGRPANMTELNPAILQGIYKGIMHEYGERAAACMVEMVASIPELSAYHFLKQLYKLEAADWQVEFSAKQRYIFSNPVGEEVRAAFLALFHEYPFREYPFRTQNHKAHDAIHKKSVIRTSVLDHPISLQG